MAAGAPPIRVPYERALAAEQRLIVYGVPYARYVAIRELLEEQGLRVAYCEGAMELMSPSVDHERLKATISRFLELFALERGIAIFPLGSMTFRSEAKSRGAEPDECYFVGTDHDEVLRPFPDIAIEVSIAPGGLDKLDIYDGLGVREVWLFWEDDHDIYVRRPEGGYVRSAKSELLPALDMDLLARFARRSDRHAALLEFRDAIRLPLALRSPDARER
ncbi:Uma2 family endonuclease [Pendulispora albinea]|uniref:Uma2 family endonuclease n=1 Tax=Pendulispora albinea TaxID=2741071 RepID=A0ABZ2M942_9BACT